MKKNSEASREAVIGAKMRLGLTESLTPKGISHYQYQYQPATMFSRKRESYQGQGMGKAVLPHGV